MKNNRKYTKTFAEAKELFLRKTGFIYGLDNSRTSTSIFKLKIKKTPTRNYFVGTKLEWLNL